MQKVIFPTEPSVTPNKVGGTPSKLRPSSTEKRSSSASKMFGKEVNLRAHTPTERRSSSSRRVRRWENANMFGLDIHRNLVEDAAEVSSNGKSLKSKYSSFNPESKTQFQAMMESQDEQLLERFRKCEEELSSLRPKITKAAKELPDNLSMAEKYPLLVQEGLLSVERRARQVLMNKVSSNMSLIEFVVELEQLLLNLLNESQNRSDPSYFEVNTQYWSNILQTTENLVNNSSVTLYFQPSLPNAAFIRLLVHGVSQYLGLSSQSFFDSKVNSGSKFMRIKKMKSVSRTLENRVSLGFFLFASLLNNLRDSETSPIRVPVYEASEINVVLFRTLLSDVRAKLMISSDNTFDSRIDGKSVDNLCADFVLVDVNDFEVEEM